MTHLINCSLTKISTKNSHQYSCHKILCCGDRYDETLDARENTHGQIEMFRSVILQLVFSSFSPFTLYPVPFYLSAMSYQLFLRLYKLYELNELYEPY